MVVLTARAISLLFLSFLSVVSVAGPVASSASSSTAVVAASPFSAESAAELMIGLGLVVALIFALAWFARRLGGVGGFSHPQLKVVASVAMGTRERLVLVQAGEQQLLLGVAPGRINLIQAFDQAIINPQETPASQFAARLKDAMGRSNKQ
ncbi:MAG: flagellar biosynthetic protein FliO [Motiliproteus sp.]